MRNFREWLSGFRDSISNYGYYVDFEKVHRNIEDIKVELQFNATGSDFSVALGSAPTEEDTTHTPFLYFYMTGVLVTNGASIPNGALFLEK